MLPHLLSAPPGQIVLVAAVIAIGAAFRALASVLRTWIEQVFRTRRLARALENSTPNQRAAIITACSQLESGSAARPGDTNAGKALAVDQRHHPPARIQQELRELKHNGD